MLALTVRTTAAFERRYIICTSSLIEFTIQLLSIHFDTVYAYTLRQWLAIPAYFPFYAFRHHLLREQMQMAIMEKTCCWRIDTIEIYYGQYLYEYWLKSLFKKYSVLR